MPKKLIPYILTLTLTFSLPARPDLWGGDVIVLSQILTQSIQQLAQLREIVSSAQNEINMMKNIHEGLDDALSVLSEIEPELDPGMFKDWRSVNQAIQEVKKIYGKSYESIDQHIYEGNDQIVAEAVVFNNKLFRDAEETDRIGQQIKQQAYNASPKGAQKLTAQSMGYLIQSQNNNLRAQAKSIKLQAQSLARTNKLDKEKTKMIIESVEEISNALSKQSSKKKFKLPRF